MPLKRCIVTRLLGWTERENGFQKNQKHPKIIWLWSATIVTARGHKGMQFWFCGISTTGAAFYGNYNFRGTITLWELQLMGAITSWEIYATNICVHTTLSEPGYDSIAESLPNMEEDLCSFQAPKRNGLNPNNKILFCTYLGNHEFHRALSEVLRGTPALPSLDTIILFEKIWG